MGPPRIDNTDERIDPAVLDATEFEPLTASLRFPPAFFTTAQVSGKHRVRLQRYTSRKTAALSI